METAGHIRQALIIGIVTAASVTFAAVLAAQGGQGSANLAPALVVGSSGNMTPLVDNLEEGPVSTRTSPGW